MRGIVRTQLDNTYEPSLPATWASYLYQSFVCSQCVFVYVSACLCVCIHECRHVWRSEDFLGHWSSPVTLFDMASLHVRILPPHISI